MHVSFVCFHLVAKLWLYQVLFASIVHGPSIACQNRSHFHVAKTQVVHVRALVTFIVVREFVKRWLGSERIKG